MNENKLGKLLFQDGSKSSQVTTRRLLYLLPSAILFVIGLILFLDPALIDEKPDDVRIPSIILLVAATLNTFLIFFIVKGFHGAIHEHGFVINNGRKTIALSFDEVKELCAFSKSIVVVDNAGKRMGLFNCFVPNLQQFTEELASAYTKYWTRVLNPETLYKASISFGKELKLDGGRFIHKNGRKIVSLDDVYDIEITEDDPESSITMIKGVDGEDLIVVPAAYMTNMDVLNLIKNMIIELRSKF